MKFPSPFFTNLFNGSSSDGTIFGYNIHFISFH